jgi:tetraacyldisaccharide 4'-kinase
MIHLKTPKFWYPDPNSTTLKTNVLAQILTPLSWVYRLGADLAAANTPYIAPCPVICVGNLTAGGAGKTPVAISIMKHLSSLYKRPVFVTKGYGGGIDEATIVSQDIHTAQDVGDEAMLLSKRGTVIIGKNRIKAMELAQTLTPDLIIMDDGYQNHAVAKQRHILVINAQTHFGNEKLLPAGPLREPIEKGIARADLICIIGKDAEAAKTSLKHHLGDKPVTCGTITVTSGIDTKQSYIGFTGLGTPQKFHIPLTISLWFSSGKQRSRWLYALRETARCGPMN